MNLPPPGRKKAILAGIIYPPESGLTSLNYTEADAAALDEQLRQLGFETVLIPSKEATRDRLETELRRCKREQGELLLFFLSAHGRLFEGSLHLFPVDSNIDGDRTLAFSTLYHMWQREFGYAKVLVILDTCRNGFVPKGGKGTELCTEDALKDVRKATESDGFVEVIYACGEGEASYEVKDLGHGLLTGCMLPVLKEMPPYLDSEWLAGKTNDRIRRWCKEHPDKGYRQTAHRYHVPTLERRIVLIDRSEEMWEETQRNHTIAAYQAYVRTFPDSTHAGEAKDGLRRLREQTAWLEACQKDSAAAYRSFLADWPDGACKDEARAKQALREAEDEAWSQAQASDSVEGFERFLEEHPGCPHVPVVGQRLEKRRKDDGDWAAAQTAGTLEAFEDYRSQHREGKHGDAARAAIQELREQHDWAEANQADTVVAYQRYRQAWPQGSHAKEARVRQAYLEARDRDWQAARTADTLTAWEDWLNRYPDGPQIPTAQARLAELREDERSWNAARARGDYGGYLAQPPGGKHREEALRRHRQAQRHPIWRVAVAMAILTGVAVFSLYWQHLANRASEAELRSQRDQFKRERDQAAVAVAEIKNNLANLVSTNQALTLSIQETRGELAQTLGNRQELENKLRLQIEEQANLNTQIHELNQKLARVESRPLFPSERQPGAKSNAVATAMAMTPPEVGKPWTNSLGMAFAPVPGTKVLFSIWETRVQDYARFIAANPNYDTGKELDDWDGKKFYRRTGNWRNLGFEQGTNHPAAGVSWQDATNFCRWLTEVERQAGRLRGDQVYRLPTDLEWSAAVGLSNEAGATPKERDMKIKVQYPWGKDWPPPKGAGNYADLTGKKKYAGRTIIGGYDDGYAETAPVGSFTPNQLGLYDLGGNVWEWCEDWYDDQQKFRVLRGGSWLNLDPDNLLSSFRFNFTPDFRSDLLGFRCVLAEGFSAVTNTRAKTPPEIGKPWTNSLGMAFAPVSGTKVLFSIWETRVQDYEAFARSNGLVWEKAFFEQGPTHPAVYVSWQDATNFCRWLTEVERQAGRLRGDQVYRLPTDLEWSAAVGLTNEVGALPADRSVELKDRYPWGTIWPPPKGAGNYADLTPKKKRTVWNIIEGYDDGYAETAPVGSFTPNQSGLYDLGGNVWEWCEDWYDNRQTARVLRGGSWPNYDPDDLLSSCRNGYSPVSLYDYIGFRCVLAVGSSL